MDGDLFFVFQLLGLGYLYIHIYIFKKISC